MAKLDLNISATTLINKKETTFTKEVTLDFEELTNSEGKIKLEVNLSSETVTVEKNINAKGKIQENGYDLLPKGVIIMWSGKDIPSGWALCDGKDDRPDLRGRFILGATIKSEHNKIEKIPINVAINSSDGKANLEYKKAISGSGLDMSKDEFIYDAKYLPPYYALYYIIKT